MNLRGIWAVFRKEFRENLRDRRTLLSALVFGPVISPILVAVLVQFLISRTETQADQDIPLAVMHAEHAPNLLNYLAARGINIEKVDFDEAGARQAVATQTHNIVLEIPADFGQRLQAGEPAPVVLYSDSSRGFERQGVARVRALVSQLRHRDRAAALPRARHRSHLGAADFRAGDRRVDAQRPFGVRAQHDDLPGAAVDVVWRPVPGHRRHRRRA